MDAPASCDPDEQDHRRRRLVKRLTAHGARMREIYELTGYTRNRQSWLRKRCGYPEERRPRGPWKTSFARFFKPEKRNDATCAAIFCGLYRADTYEMGKKAPYHLGDLEPGERLAEAWEVFQAHFPVAAIDFPEFMLIAKGLTKGEEIRLALCADCGVVVLQDLLSKEEPLCTRCEAERGGGPLSREPVNKALVKHQYKSKPQRDRKHSPGWKMRRAVKRKESGHQNAEQRQDSQHGADDRLEDDQERQDG